MPDLDGLAATREIRSKEKAARISRVPVIALTANSSPDDVSACEAAGMDGFLSKPFTSDMLERAIAHVMVATPERDHSAQLNGRV